MAGSPRLKIDGGIPNQLARVPEAAAALEINGYDGGWTFETSHDPFLPVLLAAEHTSRLELGTNIAVAFARNPMIVANVGWDLQAYSKGRFILGLGTQIQPHIEKRFSMPWSRPVRRMREFVLALRAIWSCWQDDTALRFEGEFYTHKLMTPMFVPESVPCGFPKRYLDEVTIPTLMRGIERSGRNRDDFELMCPVFVVTGESEAEVSSAAAATRKQIAFYGSTPAYRKVLELHGWGDLHDELHRLSRQGEWDRMGSLIGDEILHAFAVVAPIDALADILRSRCDGAIDRVLVGFPKTLPEMKVAEILQELRG
jgi:alkanesulfonate monooxygenase SsuD/methylene tetrahydromethanopterin reductase-like flavin-dependent oxidoreductase (luciferase family)